MQVPRSMDAGVFSRSSRPAPLSIIGLLLGLVVILIISQIIIFLSQISCFYPKRLESCDDFELTTQLTSCRSDAEYVYHDIPVNRKRTLTPLPNNFNNFIVHTVIPSFEKQRLTSYQFAVVVLTIVIHQCHEK